MSRKNISSMLVLSSIFMILALSACVTSTDQKTRPAVFMQGQLAIGDGGNYTDYWFNYQTSAVQFTVDEADVGKYFHFSAKANAPLSFFVVQGDRDGYTGGYRNADNALLVAWVNQSYLNPAMEFHAYAAGTYTLIFKSDLGIQDPTKTYLAEFIAPPSLSVYYKVEVAETSIAAAQGRSIHILESSFPATFTIEGQEVLKKDFDFKAYQVALNNVFKKYTQFLGNDYTKYGSMIGVRYPAEPAYPYCGDASSPLNVKCLTPANKIQHFNGFAHELGHVFSQAYPFVYKFGVSENNVEPAANYLAFWLPDPSGGNGSPDQDFMRFQGRMMHSLQDINASTPWHQAMTKDGFWYLLKNISGGWDGIQSVLHSYATQYKGNESTIDGAIRAEEFYRRLAQSIASPNKQQAFLSQLKLWGVPYGFVSAAQNPVDIDADGSVAGIDPDDSNALINPYNFEFLEDGIDNNLNGYIDEMVLKMSGETIRLGDDYRSYDTERGTRRRTYLEAGAFISVSATSPQGKPVKVGVYEGNIVGEGPAWWYKEADGQPSYPLVAESAKSANPFVRAQITKSGVYTIDFLGVVGDGVNVGDEVSYYINLE